MHWIDLGFISQQINLITIFGDKTILYPLAYVYMSFSNITNQNILLVRIKDLCKSTLYLKIWNYRSLILLKPTLWMDDLECFQNFASSKSPLRFSVSDSASEFGRVVRSLRSPCNEEVTTLLYLFSMSSGSLVLLKRLSKLIMV